MRICISQLHVCPVIFTLRAVLTSLYGVQTHYDDDETSA